MAGPAAAAPAIAMHGEPRHPPGFAHFDYADPDAPQGGTMRLTRTGSFDSLNPFIVRGVAAAGLGLVHQPLMIRSWDEPFTLYAGIAEDVETDDERLTVTFRLRPGARFRDGSEITVEDVLFSYRTLRRHGRPNHRTYYGQVTAAAQTGPRSVRFAFEPGNRELPLLMALMPVLSQASFEDRPFDRVGLTPLLGNGPYEVARVDPGRQIVYRRVRPHWGDDLPANAGRHNLDEIRFDYYRDEDGALTAFLAGAADLRVESDPQRWAKAYDVPARQQGEIDLLELPNRRPAGMYGIALNTRRPPFDERGNRLAVLHGFDFGWVNQTLLFGAYARTASFFANSELAAPWPPDPAELALLAPHRAALPPEALAAPYRPPDAADQAELRANLRTAADMLREAGWRVEGGVLRRDGRPFRFEVMLGSREEERLALQLQRNLARLGIDVALRRADSAQYAERLDRFDFDAAFYNWGQSLSPGTEQAFYWSSAAAGQTGSRNYPGIADPAVDALIARLVEADSREALVAATRALDRVLLWGHYVLPLYHQPGDRLAVWDRFGRPGRTPAYGYQLETWWAKR